MEHALYLPFQVFLLLFLFPVLRLDLEEREQLIHLAPIAGFVERIHQLPGCASELVDR